MQPAAIFVVVATALAIAPSLVYAGNPVRKETIYIDISCTENSKFVSEWKFAKEAIESASRRLAAPEDKDFAKIVAALFPIPKGRNYASVAKSVKG